MSNLTTSTAFPIFRCCWSLSLTHTFHIMVSADILVDSRRSFSYAAAVMSMGQMYHYGGHHALVPDTVQPFPFLINITRVTLFAQVGMNAHGKKKANGKGGSCAAVGCLSCLIKSAQLLCCHQRHHRRCHHRRCHHRRHRTHDMSHYTI